MSATVVVTRATPQAHELIRLLRQGGLSVVHFPTIRMEFRSVDIPLDRFDWVVFTSANAVRSVLCGASEVPSRVRIAALGQATAKVVRELGRAVDWISPMATGDALVHALASEVRGQSVLVAMSDRADTDRWDHLRDAGTDVQLITAYLTKCETGHSIEQRDALESADMVLFASPSAFDCCAKMVGRDTLTQLQIAAIGPTTRQAIEQAGLAVAIEATNPTTAAFAETVISYWSTSSDLSAK